jgi:general secretion pathway protein E
MAEIAGREFAEYLLAKCALPANGPLKAKKHAVQDGELSLRALWELTDLSASGFADEVAGFWRIERLRLPELLDTQGLVGQFSRRFLRETAVYPFESGDGFTLAMADPTHVAAIRAAEIVLNGPVRIVIASFEDIETVLSERMSEREVEAVAESPAAHADDDIENLRDLASGAPVVHAVSELLELAIELRASDIHIEPFRSGLMVRMRIDGVLRSIPTPVGVLPQALVSRVKILAGLNIAERRLPQDGAARLKVGRSDLDVRVATMPTQYGEAAVIRLLPKDRGLLDLTKLGLSSADEKKLSRLLTLPHGLIVITGPTGSGKTTTLATMLTILNDRTRKILTIEDPAPCAPSSGRTPM